MGKFVIWVVLAIHLHFPTDSQWNEHMVNHVLFEPFWIRFLKKAIWLQYH